MYMIRMTYMYVELHQAFIYVHENHNNVLAFVCNSYWGQYCCPVNFSSSTKKIFIFNFRFFEFLCGHYQSGEEWWFFWLLFKHSLMRNTWLPLESIFISLATLSGLYLHFFPALICQSEFFFLIRNLSTCLTFSKAQPIGRISASSI